VLVLLPYRVLLLTCVPYNTVSPAAGAVDSKGYLPVQITWSPSAKPEDNDKTLTLNIVGGNVHKAVKCSGEAAEGKLAFREKSLDLKTVAVGIPVTRTVTLRNTGTFDAVFSVDGSAFGEGSPINCEPRMGRIAHGGIADLEAEGLLRTSTQPMSNRPTESARLCNRPP